MFTTAPLSETPSSSTSSSFVIGPAEDTLLVALAELHLLTASQCCRLLYSPGSLTYVRAKLAALERDGLVERSFLKRGSRTGSTPLTYSLSGKGLRYLRRTGRDVRPRLRRSEVREYGYLHQAHSLAVSEFLLQAQLAARTVPEMQLVRLIHERDMRRSAVKVTVSSGRKVLVIPDGFLEFVLQADGKPRSCPIVLEVDRGSHGVSSWAKKVEALAVWATGAYSAVFGTPFLTIAVVVAHNAWNLEQLEQRRRQLQAWTEQVLSAMGNEPLGPVFLFGILPPATANPAQLFLAPVFTPAFGKEDVPLLERTVMAVEPLAAA